MQVDDAEVTLKSLRGLMSLLRSEQDLVVAEAVLKTAGGNLNFKLYSK